MKYVEAPGCGGPWATAQLAQSYIRSLLSRQNVGSNPGRDRGACVPEQDT